MKINLYSPKTKTAGSFTLPKEMLGRVNKPLLAQAIHVYRDRQHAGNSKVKTRGEVSLTTAKWYRQKGTGRARHGAKSAPIFVGGGVAHGPKGVKRELYLPKKMKQKALASALSLKAASKKIVAAKDLSSIRKTKDAQVLFESIYKGENAKPKAKMTVAVSQTNKDFYTFVKNIKNINTISYRDLNAYKVVYGGLLVVDVDALQPAPAKSKAKEDALPKERTSKK